MGSVGGSIVCKDRNNYLKQVLKALVLNFITIPQNSIL